MPGSKQSAAHPRETWEFQGNDRFEVRRRLGAGSFGAVFEVFDAARNARVALKLLRTVAAEDLYRFKQEFRVLAGFAHPNLVQLYELLNEGERWFFTMELVVGANILAYVRTLPGEDAADRSHARLVGAPSALSSALAEAPTVDAGPLVRAARQARGAQGPAPVLPRLPAAFDELRVRSVLVQLVEALAALHQSGTLHRDIKPSNVLVTAEGRVVLVDFGLAVRLSHSAEHSRLSIVGTPEFLAPEIVEGAAATAASDWYAVGVLLYEALTGMVPFEGTLHEILAQKITRDPRPPSAVVTGVPPDLDELCASLLERDPAARPGGAALLASLGGVSVSGPRDVPFVGRASERAALAALFGAVEAGRAAVALVEGPSGIGKSALVDQVCEDLRRRAPGVLLLASRCHEQESVPYKAIDGLIDPLSRYLKQLHPRVVEGILPPDAGALAWLFPVLHQIDALADRRVLGIPPTDPLERRRRGFDALRELLDRIARRWPVVVVIDDLQRGDHDSALLLLDLFGPPGPPPLFFLAAYRSGEAQTSDCLRTLLPGLEARRGPALQVSSFTLGALDDPEALALARSLLPEARAQDDELCATICREALGRPFLVRELCDVPTPRVASSGPPAEVSVDALVRARVAALPEGARRLLEVLSVAGRPVDRAAAQKAAEIGDDGPAIYLLLRNSRLLRSRDAGGRDELEPYHDRIREAVVAGLAPERRAACSRLLAAALEGTGQTDPETLATYHLDGGDRARAAALILVAAAAAAGSLAFDGAARLYRQALELGTDSADRAAVEEALGDALANAGRGVEAAAALVAAAAGAPPERAFELQRRAAELLLAAGDVDAGLARLRSSLAEAGVRVPERAWVVTLGTVFFFVLLAIRGLRFRPRPAAEVPAAALRRIDACWSAASALQGVDPPLGAYFAVRGTQLALAAREPSRMFDALIAFSMYGAALHGRPASVVKQALALAAEVGAGLTLPEAPLLQGLARGVGALLVGDLASLGAEITPVVPALRGFPRSRVWALNVAQECHFSHRFWTGAWKDLTAELPGVLAEARARDNRWLERSLLVRFGHVERLLADDPQGAARAHASAREGWWPPRFGLWDMVSMCLRTDVHLYEESGRGATAYHLVNEQWPSFARSPLAHLRGAVTYALHARAGASLGFAASEGRTAREREAALALADQAAHGLVALGNPLARGFGLLHTASLASARRAPEALAAWADAEAALEAADCHHLAAAARRRRGALMGGPLGATLIDQAEAWLEAQGATAPARLAAMLAPG